MCAYGFAEVTPDEVCDEPLLEEALAGNREEEKRPAASKRSGSQKRQRTKTVRVACTDEEYTAITGRAATAGLSSAAYLRACALGDTGPRAQRSPTIERGLAAQAIAELNKAGSNLNQIAHAINMAVWPGSPNVANAADAVKSAALKILQAFGYKTHDSQREPA